MPKVKIDKKEENIIEEKGVKEMKENINEVIKEENDMMVFD